MEACIDLVLIQINAPSLLNSLLDLFAEVFSYLIRMKDKSKLHPQLSLGLCMLVPSVLVQG